MNPKELREQVGRLANEADDILKKVAADGRAELRKEESDKFDAIHADIEKLSATIARLEKQEATMASLESPGRRSEPNSLENRAQATRRPNLRTITENDRCEALRAWALGGKHQASLTQEQRETAQRCGIDVGASEITLPLFSPVRLKSTNPEDLRAWQTQMDEKRAALTGIQSTTTTGGYTVADAAMQSLEIALLAYGGMRAVSTNIRTSTGGPLPFPTTNDTTQKGRLLSENTGATETEMTFGQLVLDAWKYSSDYILASVEFMNDSSINVASFLGNALGTRIARLQNDHFTTGTGSSQPNGVVTAATSGVTGVADPPTYDNVVDLVHSVDPAYRVNGRFMMHDSTLKSLKKIKVLQYSGDTTGYPLWSPGLAPGQPNTILGYEYIINQSVAAPGSSAKKIVFGDFSKYLIRDVVDVTLIRLDERFAELHQVAFLAFARSDGDLLDAGTHPIKYMSQA